MRALLPSLLPAVLQRMTIGLSRLLLCAVSQTNLVAWF